MKPLIIANWKMNPANSKEAFDLARAVTKGVQGLEAQVVLCPPFLYIPQLLPLRNVHMGAQDCFWENEGPYTGEIGPSMLKSLGCTYVILGHSERKRYFNETAEMVNAKIKAVLQRELIPVVCVDESEKNLEELVTGISQSELKNSVFVYEPAWAISTSNGQAATPQHMREAAVFMRKFLPAPIPILYGGSVESSNIKSFLGPELAQGALVGGASLDAEEFIALVRNAALV